MNSGWRHQLITQKYNNDVLYAIIGRAINEIDIICSAQLSHIIQNQHFSALEARWCSLYNLVYSLTSVSRIQVRILDLTWNSLSLDLNTAFNLRNTLLYHLVYHKELNTAGGLPFGALLIDHPLQFNSLDEYDELYTAQQLAQLGELTLCPIIMGVDNDFLGEDPHLLWADTKKVERILHSDDYALWQLLRAHSSARFFYLTLPDYILRAPYHNLKIGFQFKQSIDKSACLWGNAAYLLLMNIIREFERISWFGFLRSYDQRGKVGAIIHYINYLSQQETESKLEGRVDIASEQDSFWSAQGFIPFTSLYLSGQKGFFSNNSVWLATNSQQRQLGMLQTNLMACRFGHAIKQQIRDKIGSYDSLDDCRRSIEGWLQKYISDVDYGDDSIMAHYPLKSATVILQASSVDSTLYQCAITLRPQYQYDVSESEINITLQLAKQDIGDGI